jgi:hypothetical protein
VVFPPFEAVSVVCTGFVAVAPVPSVSVLSKPPGERWH